MTISPLVFALCVLAGGVGAVLRFVVDGALHQRFPRIGPWPTFIINVVGSLAAALPALVSATAAAGAASGSYGFVAGAESSSAALVIEQAISLGLLGGFTTFSTASFEAVSLLRRRAYAHAVAYALLTPLACIGAVWLVRAAFGVAV